MYILNTVTFRNALKSSGFSSVSDLTKHLGIHRNTAQYYLKGAPVINEKLQKMLDAVKISPKDAFIKLEEGSSAVNQDIARFADMLSRNIEGVVVILFGSRSRGKCHKYSDYDIGVFSINNISNKDFLKLIKHKEDFEERTPYMIDLVNLNAVDKSFIKNIIKDAKFLSGSAESWLNLRDSIS